MTEAHVMRQGESVDGDTLVFERYESEVRSYCRAFPEVFTRAQGALLHGESGRTYIDFLSGAGALNYGHNDPTVKAAVVDHLAADGVVHSLDLHTAAKREFIRRFVATILEPRGLDYKLQFCGPTGTNAVEAALKLARLVTGRRDVLTFMGGYHGMSLGSLGVTGNRAGRAAAGIPLAHATFVPYESGPFGAFDSLGYIERALADPNSGVDRPAAIIVETVQAEGGVYVASDEWLRGLAGLCRRHEILLICDEIQTGCGRTGTFFSFERAGLAPDIVTLSKSLSGLGLPLSMVLIRRPYDVWTPAAHTGTFRGHQLGLVGATAALSFWQDEAFAAEVNRKGAALRQFVGRVTRRMPGAAGRGLGMLWGIDLTACGGPAAAERVSRACFEAGLIVERCGRDDTVLKLLPPLTIPTGLLEQGCGILEKALITLAS